MKRREFLGFAGRIAGTAVLGGCAPYSLFRKVGILEPQKNLLNKD